jgi:hypothetical protein
MIVAHAAMPFLLAGMAIGRLDLVRSAGRLIVGGVLDAALGYRGSWLAMDVLAATGWRSLVGRGPLQTMLHTASARAGGAR